MFNFSQSSALEKGIARVDAAERNAWAFSGVHCCCLIEKHIRFLPPSPVARLHAEGSVPYRSSSRLPNTTLAVS